MAHRKLTNASEVAAYLRYLEDGYPARQQVMAHLSEQLELATSVTDGGHAPRILELACGPGVLAETILNKMPVSEYVGVDIARASLDYARALMTNIDARTTWLQGDLNEPNWLDQIDGTFDAITSMQALHDLGGGGEVARIVTIARTLLTPDGLLIYADLLRKPDDSADAHPGRFTVAQHLAMLKRAGYGHVECTMQLDGFGCFAAA